MKIIWKIYKYKEESIIIQDQIKKITDLSFQYNVTKSESEKEKIDEELKSILLDLKTQAINNFKDESDIKKFLDNVVRFHQYSFNNQLLIYLQNPKAEFVASSRTFQSMGYSVKQAELDQGMKILIPSFFLLVKVKNENNAYDIIPYSNLTEDQKKIYRDKNDDQIIFYKNKLTNFKLGTVYDATQTNMPLDKIQDQLNPYLYDEHASGYEDVFIKTIYRDGYKVKYEDEISLGAKGYRDFQNKTIVVKKGLGNLMRLKVVIHEYAHALAHQHLLHNHLDYEEHQNKYETEAESIAYVVSKYLGLNTSDYSCTYLYSWSKEKDFQEIEDSFSTIINYSKKIIDNFNHFYDQKFDLAKEQTPSICI